MQGIIKNYYPQYVLRYIIDLNNSETIFVLILISYIIDILNKDRSYDKNVTLKIEWLSFYKNNN